MWIVNYNFSFHSLQQQLCSLKRKQFLVQSFRSQHIFACMGRNGVLNCSIYAYSRHVELISCFYSMFAVQDRFRLEPVKGSSTLQGICFSFWGSWYDLLWIVYWLYATNNLVDHVILLFVEQERFCWNFTYELLLWTLK